MKPHPAQSKWYEWPLSLEPISYWYGNVEKGKIVQRIDLAGNIFVYLLSSFFVIIATGVAFKCLVRFFKRKYRLRHDDKALIFLVVCYWMNVLPFILISRPMFLYHYFVAFVFSVLIFMQLLSRFFRHEEEQIKVICYALVSISALIFLLSSSHTYGYRPYKNVPQIPVWGLEEKRF
jgi:dolichyl-phosphate-mannose--protein O-mannosyl transferase